MNRVWGRTTERGKWHHGKLLRCHRIRTRCGKTEVIQGEPCEAPGGERCGSCERLRRLGLKR